MRNLKTRLFVAAAVAAISAAGQAWAGTVIDVTFDRPKNGLVEETVSFDRARVTIWPTDKDKKDIVASDPLKAQWPYSAEVGVKPGPGQKTGNPKLAVGIQPEEGGKTVYDVHQRIEELPYTPPKGLAAADPSVGEVSDLSIESLFFDSAAGQFGLSNIFGTLARRVGQMQLVDIPDLYADTNGDGVIGAGDVLYSLVDLNVFLGQPHSFHLGDTFNIVDGVAAGLARMWFSDSPFEFDPAIGFSTNGQPLISLGPSSLASGGFSGTGVVESNHGVAALPEPSAWLLMILGFGVVGSAVRREAVRRAMGSARAQSAPQNRRATPT